MERMANVRFREIVDASHTVKEEIKTKQVRWPCATDRRSWMQPRRCRSEDTQEEAVAGTEWIVRENWRLGLGRLDRMI